MKRRHIIKMVAAIPALFINRGVFESNETYYAMHVPSGTSVGANIKSAIAIAQKKDKKVLFTFNYVDHFVVKPDGTWICEREGGGMPVCGPNSEFVPPEGWSKFYGH